MGLSTGRAGLVDKQGFVRELSIETGLFVEKLWLMMGLSIRRAVLVEMINYYELFRSGCS